MGNSLTDTADALDSLLRSEGWRYLSDLCRKEWTERERIGWRNALNDTDDKRALDKLRLITAAQEAVAWVLMLPREEIARLRRQEQASKAERAQMSMSRRGSL